MNTKEGVNLKNLVYDYVQANPYVKASELPQRIFEKYGVNLKYSTGSCYLTEVRRVMANSNSSGVKPSKVLKEVTLGDMQFFMDYMKGMKNGRQKLRSALETLKPLVERFDSISRIHEVMNFCDKARGIGSKEVVDKKEDAVDNTV